MAYISVPEIQRTLPQRYRLVGLKCKKCGYLHFPARKICKSCGAVEEFEEVKLSGRGRVYSYTVIEQGATVYEHTEEAAVGGAFPVAIVELEEGVRVMGQITECDPYSVRVGMEVEAVLRRIYEQDIVRYSFKFRPIRFQGKTGEQ